MHAFALAILWLKSQIAFAAQNCSSLQCPEGHVAKVLAAAALCQADCDVAVDLYTCCNQLCSSFTCTGSSSLRPESSAIACDGPCLPEDRAKCCDFPPVQDDGTQLLRAVIAGEAGMSSNHLLRFGVPSSDLAQVSEVDRLVAMSVTAKATAALHIAALHGHSETLRRLIEGRADVNQLDDRGWAPLHVAAGAGRIEVMNSLIAARAIPDLQSPDGTPYDIALRAVPRGPDPPLISVLLSQHARAWQDELNF
ncbi:unnamed protein product [Effrenium voratum]|nr:unnamed protein product [Effrenium voratum]